MLSNKGVAGKPFTVRIEMSGGGVAGKQVIYEEKHTREDKEVLVEVSGNGQAMIEIYIDNKLIQTVHASNGKELSYSFVPSEEGMKTITLKTNEYSCDLIVHVNKTTMDLLEVKDGLELSLSAVGRSNNDSNLADWSYRDYTTQFSGFN
jgi:hypothetical protein